MAILPQLIVANHCLKQSDWLLTNTRTKSTIETLEKEGRYIQSQQQRDQIDVVEVVLVSLLLTLNIFHTSF